MAIDTTDPITTTVKPAQALDTVYEMINGFIALAPMLAVGIAVFALFFLIAKFVRRFFKSDGDGRTGRQEAMGG